MEQKCPGCSTTVTLCLEESDIEGVALKELLETKTVQVLTNILKLQQTRTVVGSCQGLTRATNVRSLRRFRLQLAHTSPYTKDGRM